MCAAENHHFRLHSEYVEYLDNIGFFKHFPHNKVRDKFKYSLMLEYITKLLDEVIRIPGLELPKFIKFVQNGGGFKIAGDMWGIAQIEGNNDIDGHCKIMEDPLNIFKRATKDEDFWNKVYEV